jgi:hypothetical protein
MGGGDSQPSAVASAATNTPAPAIASPTPYPTQEPVNVFIRPTGTPTSLPDRTNCDEIRSTAYHSDSEREWFVINCGIPTFVPEAPSGPTDSPPPPPSEQPPPTPNTGLSAGEAVSAAARWLRTQSSTHYNVSESSCTAGEVGTHWVVTCSGTVVGCGGSACDVTVSVCVLQSATVLPSGAC